MKANSYSQQGLKNQFNKKKPKIDNSKKIKCLAES